MGSRGARVSSCSPVTKKRLLPSVLINALTGSSFSKILDFGKNGASKTTESSEHDFNTNSIFPDKIYLLTALIKWPYVARKRKWHVPWKTLVKCSGFSLFDVCPEVLPEISSFWQVLGRRDQTLLNISSEKQLPCSKKSNYVLLVSVWRYRLTKLVCYFVSLS